MLHVIDDHTCVCVWGGGVKREGEREVASTKVALYRKTIRTFTPAGWHVRIRLTPAHRFPRVHLRLFSVHRIVRTGAQRRTNLISGAYLAN